MLLMGKRKGDEWLEAAGSGGLKHAVSSSSVERKSLNRFATRASKLARNFRRKTPRRRGSCRSDLQRDAKRYFVVAGSPADGRAGDGESPPGGVRLIKKFAFKACVLRVASQH